ncbi:MAG: DEAD/DEAH box helicase [Dehalococcoidia bacterium]|nr:DEAD/DEAH box helicase [Dehalococcoidia bacterium]
MLQDERAERRELTRVFLGHAGIASLEPDELLALGLPPAAGVGVELKAFGSLRDPDFRIDLSLRRPRGNRVVSFSREGCFLTIDGEQFTLRDPLYSICEALDRFNRDCRDLDSRLRAWGEIRQILPEGVQIDHILGGIEVAVASAFSIERFVNELGEPDFNPVLGTMAMEREELGSASPGRRFVRTLPPARHQNFARYFRQLTPVRDKYPVGEGFYVFLTPTLQRILSAVRRIQAADPGTRLQFIRQPAPFLRSELSNEEEGEPAEAAEQEPESLADPLESLFSDEGYSERVKGIGLWQPRVLPWLKRPSEPWLPAEQGLLIGDESLSLPHDQARELLRLVEQALRNGSPAVQWGSQRVPVSEDTVRALRELCRSEVPATPTTRPEDTREQDPAPIALLIFDNLESLEYRVTRRRQTPTSGEVPERLATALLPHQREALRWLQRHWSEGSPGALLADDMGLGKTLVTLAFLAWLQEVAAGEEGPNRGNGSFLVVAPTGLIRNWLDEHARHLRQPGLGRIAQACGRGLRELRGASSGRETAHGFATLDQGALERANLVLTTYETLRDYQYSFGRVRWSVAVFDEAQKIKNPAILLTDAAKALKHDFALAVTGTPVENRIEDLWSIVDCVRPGELGTLRDFSSAYGSTEAQEERLPELYERLSAGSTPPIMLRRTKEKCLEGLPDKRVHRLEREMPPRQADAYDLVVRQAEKTGMLQTLQLLRRVSLHPSPLALHGDDGYIEASARLQLAIEILDDIRRTGEKALLFVDDRPVQSALLEILQRRYRLGEPILVINGEVAGAARKQRVNEFQARKGFDVMILSPRAGGLGLTLTAANHVIHLGRWWNPAVEDQCTDRVYRIGQEKTVHVYCCLAVHPRYRQRSFDLVLDGLLERKRELYRRVLMPTELSRSDLEALYRETVGVRRG